MELRKKIVSLLIILPLLLPVWTSCHADGNSTVQEAQGEVQQTGEPTEKGSETPVSTEAAAAETVSPTYGKHDDYKIGTIGSANGQYKENDTRFAFEPYLILDRLEKVTLNKSYEMVWFAYDENRAYLGNGAGDWLGAGVSFSREEVLGFYPNAAYVRFAVKRMDEQTMSLDTDLENSEITITLTDGSYEEGERPVFTEESYFTEEIYRNGEEYLRYYRYESSTTEKKPLIIYLHGAGSRGDQLSKIDRVGVLGEIDQGRVLDAVVVVPQCHKDTWYDHYETLLSLIEACIKEESVDADRVYLCGMSMGGYAAWSVAMSHPEWFAALVPVCGGGMYWNADRLVDVPIWAFHGALDDRVFVEESQHMVDAVNRAGGNAKLTIYPDVAHDAWFRAFADDEMWDWMFAQEK